MALKDPVAGGPVLYDFMRLPWGIVTFTITLTSLFVLWPVLPFIARGLANADRAMVRGLLSPSDELERRIAELESDRGVVVDTAAPICGGSSAICTTGRRPGWSIWRWGSGWPRRSCWRGRPTSTVAAMVDEAHGEVKLALQELRDLARGIHPAVLTDRGLDAALSSVASRCTVPVKVTADWRTAGRRHRGHRLLHRLRAAAEHQQAQRCPYASVDVWRSEDRLLIQVWDDGRGGARLDGGTGMRGLADRLGAVDGLFVLDSPARRAHDGHGGVALAGTPTSERNRPRAFLADGR
jgi:hypothetical protein